MQNICKEHGQGKATSLLVGVAIALSATAFGASATSATSVVWTKHDEEQCRIGNAELVRGAVEYFTGVRLKLKEE